MEHRERKQYLVCVDSDGCVFDNMDIKWKECFIPALIRCFELQPIASCVREEAERINLYSKTRGVNRYAGIPLLFDALEKRVELKRYHFNLPDIRVLKKWVQTTKQLSMESLKEAYDKTRDVTLERTILWSYEASRSIEEMIFGIPPFPGVMETFERIKKKADLAVLSSANKAAIEREWSEQQLLEQVDFLCSQEMGSKKECIEKMLKLGYDKEHILVIGDAPGDQQAAEANGTAFYPIIPGKGDICWQRLAREALPLFWSGKHEETFAMYQKEFCRILHV